MKNKQITEEQRKEAIFSIMDDLHAKKEHFNADLVAKLAKMGKQSILPFYNQWKTLHNQAEDLPVSITNALKRLLTQWKLEANKKQTQAIQQAQDEIELIQKDKQQLVNDLNTTQNVLIESQNKNKLLEEKLTLINKKYTDLDKNISMKQNECELYNKQINQLQKQIESQIDQHMKILHHQEKQLTQQHEQQASYWMNMLDKEKQEKKQLNTQMKTIEKHIEKQKIKHQQLADKNHLLNTEIKNKNAQYLSLEKKLSSLEQYENQNNQLCKMLSSQENDIVKNIQKLIKNNETLSINQQLLKEKNQKVEQLENSLKENSKQIAKINQLQEALAKEQGFSQALKIALNQQSTNNKKD